MAALLEINYETLDIMTRFIGAMLGLFGVVLILALLTPKLAAWIDRKRGVSAEKEIPPSGVEDFYRNDSGVCGIYDPQTADNQNNDLQGEDNNGKQ